MDLEEEKEEEEEVNKEAAAPSGGEMIKTDKNRKSGRKLPPPTQPVGERRRVLVAPRWITSRRVTALCGMMSASPLREIDWRRGLASALRGTNPRRARPGEACESQILILKR